MSSLSHHIHRISLVVFEHGLDGRGKHNQLFLAKAGSDVFEKVILKENIGVENTQILCSSC